MFEYFKKNQKQSLEKQPERRFTMLRFFWHAFICCAFLSVIVTTVGFLYFASDLPNYKQLAQYDPPTTTHVYTQKGLLVAEYAKEKRIFIKYNDIPQLVIDAFLAAEDKNFFAHQGLDFLSILRAGVQSIMNLKNNKRAVGASTITQQVVRNFLLNNERELTRKIREAILAYRISKVYSKEQILELYLNQIFLGHNSYGIVAAARNYFGKELNDLTAAESAMLAALPKAPSTINPFTYPDRAKSRRNWVIKRMVNDGFIREAIGTAAILEPIKLKSIQKTESADTKEFYLEAVRQELIKLLGEERLYSSGLTVIINMDEEIQKKATETFIAGLNKYDRRHGWRGPLTRLVTVDDWQQKLQEVSKPVDIMPYQQLAVVLKVTPTNATIGLENGTESNIPLTSVLWARKNLKEQKIGPIIKKVSEVLQKGDVILVKLSPNQPSAKTATLEQKATTNQNFILEQIPNANGAVVVIEPYTNRVLALVGGYSFANSKFNRATQAKRQPGSAFKPFVYLTGLENGFTTETIVSDSAISVNLGNGAENWQPKNAKKTFLGDITLTTALIKSSNMCTIRMTLAVGIPRVIQTAKKLGIYQDNLTNYTIASALGSFETTPLNLTNAYNTIVSKGYYGEPKLIQAVYSKEGEILYTDSDINCQGCDFFHSDSTPPNIIIHRTKAINEDAQTQITQMLQASGATSLIKSGIKRPDIQIAGKTGTTNNVNDSWFVGFTPSYTIGVYVGFDSPRTLGLTEWGSTIAMPIFANLVDQIIPLNSNDNDFFKIPNKIILQEKEGIFDALYYNSQDNFDPIQPDKLLDKYHPISNQDIEEMPWLAESQRAEDND